MMSVIPPETLLGAAWSDALVPYHPAHWVELRARERDPRAAATNDEAVAVSLSMSCLVRTVLIGSRPECIVGLWLTPDSAAPWIMAPDPTVERLNRAIRVCTDFIAECTCWNPVLRTERDRTDTATVHWLAGLGFQQVAGSACECWERRLNEG